MNNAKGNWDYVENLLNQDKGFCRSRVMLIQGYFYPDLKNILILILKFVSYETSPVNLWIYLLVSTELHTLFYFNIFPAETIVRLWILNFIWYFYFILLLLYWYFYFIWYLYFIWYFYFIWYILAGISFYSIVL